MKRLKNIVPLCIAIIMIIQSCYPIPSKRKLKGRIVKHFKDNYQVDVEVVKVTRALHLDWNSFSYGVSLVDAPLTVIGGLYNAKEDKFFRVNVPYSVFQAELSKILRDLTMFDDLIAKCYFSFGKVDDSEYQINKIKELSAKYKDLCNFNIHIYCFDYNTKEDIEWHKFQPVIDYFKNFPDAEFSFMFSFYPSETFNSEDLLANGFGFSYDYHGFETSFEGVNLNKRLDHMEYTDIGLDSLEAQWNAKLLEVEMQKKKD